MTPVALLAAAGSGLSAATCRELQVESWEITILSPPGRGSALADDLGVTGSNASVDDLRRPGYGGRTVAA